LSHEHASDEVGRARHRAIRVLRWVLVPPAMAFAFLAAALAGGIPCVVFHVEKGLPAVAALCAFAWVGAACLVAPSHKRATATVALLLGAAAAWWLAGAAPVPGAGRFPVFAITCCGGLLALALAFRLRAGSFAKLPQLFIEGTAAMHIETAARRTVRNLVIAAALAWGGWMLARGVIDIIPQQSRGLHMRLGKYTGTLEPGLHLKIPLVDQIIGVPVTERQGYIQHVDAMTQDNVIMKLSLQYTYEITDPRRYRLEVQDPDAIIREFVQGKLRDIVNTISMNDVMKKRQELGEHVTTDLAAKEQDFGVHFKLVQVQGAFPPPEVQEAIKQRMVSEQQTVAAKEQATQKQIIADASYYEAGKRTQATRFEIEETAKAQKTPSACCWRSSPSTSSWATRTCSTSPPRRSRTTASGSSPAAPPRSSISIRKARPRPGRCSGRGRRGQLADRKTSVGGRARPERTRGLQFRATGSMRVRGAPGRGRSGPWSGACGPRQRRSGWARTGGCAGRSSASSRSSAPAPGA
jgi:regulator of protease activity HflC (stomatin/prohibitin superfamily)